MSQETKTEEKKLPAQQNSVKTFFAREDVKAKIQELMGSRAPAFTTSVLGIVNSNTNLKNATPESIFMAAMMAAALDLPVNPNLGFAYIIPYNEKYQDAEGQWKSRQVAQFQVGYKGFIQLAQRSGVFKTISACPVYEGQIISENPLTGFVFDFSQRKSNKVIGFAAYFSLLNGFEKTFYMTADQTNEHGKKYSKTFNNKNSRWALDFEGMSLKTVIKLLLSKYAPMSIQMQNAVISDQAIINNVENVDVTYVDEMEENKNEAQKEIAETAANNIVDNMTKESNVE